MKKRRMLTPEEQARSRRLAAEYAEQDAAAAASRPKSPLRSSTAGPLASWLLAHGWTRESVEFYGQECEAETEESICHRSARWSRVQPSRGPLCAAHARQAQTEIDVYDRRYPRADRS